MIRIEVKKNQNETTGGMARRFTKKVQSAGIIKTAKGLRYKTRSKSSFVKKKNALKRLQKSKEREKLRKLGKLSDGYRK